MQQQYKTFDFDTSEMSIWYPTNIVEMESDCKGIIPVYLYIKLFSTANNFSVVDFKRLCGFCKFTYQNNSTKTVKKVNKIFEALHQFGIIQRPVEFNTVAGCVFTQNNPDYFSIGHKTDVIFREMKLADYELLRNYRPVPNDDNKTSFSTLLTVYMYLQSRMNNRRNNNKSERIKYPYAVATSMAKIANDLKKNNSNYIIAACKTLSDLGLIYYGEPIRVVVNDVYPPVCLNRIFAEKKKASSTRDDWQREYAMAYYNEVNRLTAYYASKKCKFAIQGGLPKEVQDDVLGHITIKARIPTEGEDIF